MITAGDFKKGVTIEWDGGVWNIVDFQHVKPGFKGDTASNTYKPATVETGYELMVPLFINIGDVIKIDTRSGEYLSRA